MYTNKDGAYLTPEVEVLAIAVERGFESSFTVGDWGDGGEHGGSAE